jgi:hypothetical protein
MAEKAVQILGIGINFEPSMNSTLQEQESQGTDELRSSVRFPLILPIQVVTESNERILARTQNISAGGVLFDAAERLPVGSRVEFQIEMPAMVLGTPGNIAVQCIGRVVRCLPAEQHNEVAVVIDDYCFQRF